MDFNLKVTIGLDAELTPIVRKYVDAIGRVQAAMPQQPLPVFDHAGAVVTPELKGAHSGDPEIAVVEPAPAARVAKRSGKGKNALVLKGPRQDLEVTLFLDETDWKGKATKTLAEWVMFCNSVPMAEEMLGDPANRQAMSALDDQHKAVVSAALKQLASVVQQEPKDGAPFAESDLDAAPEVLVPTADDVLEAALVVMDKFTKNGDDKDARKLLAEFMQNAFAPLNGATRRMNSLKEPHEFALAYAGLKGFLEAKDKTAPCLADTAKWAKGLAASMGAVATKAPEPATNAFDL